MRSRVREIALLSASSSPFVSRQRLWAGPDVQPTPMPRPDVLLLEEDENGHAFLYRYTAAGDFAGDTWHETAADARDAAAEEYGEEVVGPWTAVPESVTDLHQWAIVQAANRTGD